MRAENHRRPHRSEDPRGGADLLLAGSFDQVTEGLAAYAAAGATDLRIMVHAGNDDERQATRGALASALKATA